MSGSTGRKVWPESQTHGETMVLEAIASGRRLDEILELLIQTTEQQYAGMIGSILFLEGPNLYARISIMKPLMVLRSARASALVGPRPSVASRVSILIPAERTLAISNEIAHKPRSASY